MGKLKKFYTQNRRGVRQSRSRKRGGKNLGDSVVGKLFSGETVRHRPSYPHMQKGIERYLPGILKQINSKNRIEIKEEIVFDRNVGDCLAIETKSDDKIIWAVRSDRETIQQETRFVKNKPSHQTNTISVVLLKDRYELNVYKVVTSYFGTLVSYENQKEYWAHHALVWGSIPVHPHSIRYE